MMNLNLTISMLAAGCLLAGCAAPAGTRDADREKTAFQTGRPWKDVTDNRADVAIIYDTNDAPGMSFEERVESWRSKGYKTHFMTGIAWGSYQDYFTGFHSFTNVNRCCSILYFLSRKYFASGIFLKISKTIYYQK